MNRAMAMIALIGIVTTAGGAAGATSSGPGEAGRGRQASDPSDPSGLATYYRQPVHWTTCRRGPDDETGRLLDQAGAECAEIRVPLDYRRPSGRTITVAMSRLKATDTANRIGALLVNVGGPGGPALQMPPRLLAKMGAVGARYDIIGMDPRGVGRSTPVDCDWPTGGSRLSAGRSQDDFEHVAGVIADLADRCATDDDSALLPYITTRNTARDMDVVRGVLGEQQISYLGMSYGTYLGAVYTALFPEHTDRVVLDGPADPRTFGGNNIAQSGPYNEAALWDWAGWAAEHDDTYHLGRTSIEVIGTVHRTLRAAERRPLKVGDYQVDQHLLPTLLFVRLDDDRDPANAILADAVGILRDAAAGKLVEPTPELEQLLRNFLTGTTSAHGSSQAAVMCDDVAVPRDLDYYWQRVQSARPAQPVFGPLVNNVGVCAFWPTTPIERPVRRPGDVPALIVAATGDPRSIYPNGVSLHQQMPQSRLLTFHARIHVAYLRYDDPCVDNVVDSYFATGELPAANPTCDPAGT
jgi:pimeloyl-ACP methyl ester carboxylesterase